MKDSVPYNNSFPFGRIHNVVTNDMNIDAGAYRLFVVLWTSTLKPKKGGKKFTPNPKSLAAQFKVKERTIFRWLNNLEDNGYITRDGDNYDTKLKLHPYPLTDKNDSKHGDK